MLVVMVIRGVLVMEEDEEGGGGGKGGIEGRTHFRHYCSGSETCPGLERLPKWRPFPLGSPQRSAGWAPCRQWQEGG